MSRVVCMNHLEWDTAHHQGFKLQLMGEGDVLLGNTGGSGNTVTSGSSWGKPQIILEVCGKVLSRR